MGIVGRISKWMLGALLALAVALAGWLYFAPPALIRLGAGYSAKIVCSNVFLAGRDANEVLRVDVQAPGHPLLKYMSVNVDEAAGTVTAGLFGVFGRSAAVARPGTGCATVPDGNFAAARTFSTMPPPTHPIADALWPDGEEVEPSQDPAIAAVLDDPALTGPGMRAVVVAHAGRIIGERYAPGFTPETPLLGWSMSKTVTAAIVGTLLRDDRLSLDQNGLFEAWSIDERSEITVADLMAMSSGLEFNEDYGDVTDVTRMLYLQPDMAEFALDKPLAHPLGEFFSYSSGTTVMLSRIWQDAFDDGNAALAWPRERLFGPIGMNSAVMEADARGTFVGSSYVYATARDWARFGEFLRNDGNWQGKQILPEGFVAWMREPAPASNGEYGRGQVWLQGSADERNGEGSDQQAGVPGDTFWALGHDGQSVAVIPSRELVVVRLGLTPSDLGYKRQALTAALVAALD
ncbi:serine hydrolase [Aquamicrobium sp. LC103]|uniref:serine hydrolase domain-containing protein n=1 Tax=Aquamicrobium sp. LC103 TaxID=1120658 RepID=UPI00063ED1C6|nr:serine hydrolase [Aquamicrobium sp. LC103]TKT74133.1 serine hydrolase [Aquamicrobium sp. LC103]